MKYRAVTIHIRVHEESAYARAKEIDIKVVFFVLID